MLARLHALCPKINHSNSVENCLVPIDAVIENLIQQSDPAVSTDWNLTLMPWV